MKKKRTRYSLAIASLSRVQSNGGLCSKTTKRIMLVSMINDFHSVAVQCLFWLWPSFETIGQFVAKLFFSLWIQLSKRNSSVLWKKVISTRSLLNNIQCLIFMSFVELFPTLAITFSFSNDLFRKEHNLKKFKFHFMKWKKKHENWKHWVEMFCSI